jgi:hypothetical protein
VAATPPIQAAVRIRGLPGVSVGVCVLASYGLVLAGMLVMKW